MDKREIKKRFAKTGEDEILIGRLLDLADRATRGYPVYTKFLTPHERVITKELCRFLGIAICFDGGYEEAERAVAAFLPDYLEEAREDREFPVCLVAIRPKGKAFSRELTHRDYLGAMMGLDIKREVIGDIAIGEDGAQVFILKQAVPILLHELQKVGSQGIAAEEIPLEAFTLPREKRESRHVFVASMRIDAIVAEGFGLSRTKAAEKITAGQTSLNHEECLKPAAEIAQGDTIALRGHGRITIGQMGGTSRKGRRSVEIILWK